MQSEETLTPIQLALTESLSAASLVALTDESLLILNQKRRTLEEKAISKYFHRLSRANANIIAQLHSRIYEHDSIDENTVEQLHRLRTVNENVRSCVAELLKILKYDFNYLEQYYEYDYCARLLNNEEMVASLERIQAALEQKS